MLPPENGPLFRKKKKKEKQLLIFDCKPSSIFSIERVALHLEAWDRCRSCCVIATRVCINLYMLENVFFPSNSLLSRSHMNVGRQNKTKKIDRKGKRHDEQDFVVFHFTILQRVFTHSHKKTKETDRIPTGIRLSATHFSTKNQWTFVGNDNPVAKWYILNPFRHVSHFKHSTAVSEHTQTRTHEHMPNEYLWKPEQ